MAGLLRRLPVLLALLLVLGASRAPAADGGERQEQLRELLNEAIDHYQLKQYAQAKAKLDALIAMDPTNTEAYQLVELVGDAIMSEMAVNVRRKRDMGRGPLELVKRASQYERKKLLTPENIKATVAAAVSNDSEALVKLRTIGQFAVPYLVEFLKEETSQDRRVNATYILTQMGKVAVWPLLEALKADDTMMKQNILQILAQVRPADPRIIPQLREIHQTAELEVLRRWAGRGLKHVTGQDPEQLRPAVDYYYLEADRYFRGGRTVDEELDILDGVYWQWDADAQTLVHHEVPTFALRGLLGEERVFGGLDLQPDDYRLIQLLSGLYVQEQARVEGIVNALELNEVARPDSAEALAQAQAWEHHWSRNLDIAATIGSRQILGVLNKGLTDGDADVAVGAIRLLEESTSWYNIAQYEPASFGATLSRDEVASETSAVEDADGMQDAGQDQTEPKETTKDAEQSADTTDAEGDDAKGGEAAREAGSDPAAGGASPSHPLLMALRYPDRRVQYAAANCLYRIGLPVEAAAYGELLPILVDGALEHVPSVVLVVSNDQALRDHLNKVLEERGLQVITSRNGRQGVRRAAEYPPKDAIFVDGHLAEFEHIALRLQMQRPSRNSPLPLTVVTSNARAGEISDELDDANYRVEIMKDVEPDREDLFKRVASIGRGGERSVVLITNEDLQKRARIRQMLVQQTQELLNPQAAAEISQALKDEGDGAGGILGAYANVYLDDELSGFDAMRTLQELNSDPRTRPVPVGILSREGNRSYIAERFKSFLGDPAEARILSASLSADEFISSIEQMRSVNPLSEENYARRQALETAKASAEALAGLEYANTRALTGDEVEAIMDALKNRLDEDLRILLSRALGHFRAGKASGLLAKVADDSGEPLALRAACLRALGRIDTDGRRHEFKVRLLKESPERSLQQAAGEALARETIPLRDRTETLDELRVGIPEEGALEPEAADEGAEPVRTEAVDEAPVPAGTEEDDDEGTGWDADLDTDTEAAEPATEDAPVDEWGAGTESDVEEETEDEAGWGAGDAGEDAGETDEGGWAW